MLLQIKLCLFAPCLKIIVMAKTKKIHDYSKPAKVNKILFDAFYKLGSVRPCDVLEARKLIGSARELLDEYLAGDNLIPDDEDSQIYNSVPSFAGETSDDLPF